MPRIYIDEDGNKYEAVDSELTEGQLITIKAISEEKFWSLWFCPDGENAVALFSRKLTTKEAYAVSQAIKSLIDFIENVAEPYKTYLGDYSFHHRALEAKHALTKEL